MSYPNFTDVTTITFGSWSGVLPIYSLKNGESNVLKTDLPLNITLSVVNNNQSGIVKISFVNSKFNISQEILSYSKKCTLAFNQLQLIPIIEGNSIQLSVDGELEFIEDNKLKISIAGSAINIIDNTESSFASQSIFISH